MKKDFLVLTDRTPKELENLIKKGIELKGLRRKNVSHKYLNGKTLAMIFEKSSTRTRISFETGMYELGGTALFLSSRDIQLGRGETVADTARVMSRYVDGIMIRTFAHERVEEFAKYSEVSVINGLTDSYHPCQIMADIMTIYEIFGGTSGIKVAYIGDGNNMAHSWLNGCALFGMDLAIASPEKYTVKKSIYEKANKIAEMNGTKLTLTKSPEEAVQNANVVYTDVWVSMGQEDEAQSRIADFRGFQVNSTLMDKATKNAVFMHCLPAHRGEEVSEELLESKRSVVFDEAENRLHIQKAILMDAMLEN